MARSGGSALFGQFVAAKGIPNAGKCGRHSHDEKGVRVRIPDFDVARLDQKIAIPEMIFPGVGAVVDVLPTGFHVRSVQSCRRAPLLLRPGKRGGLFPSSSGGRALRPPSLGIVRLLRQITVLRGNPEEHGLEFPAVSAGCASLVRGRPAQIAPRFVGISCHRLASSDPDRKRLCWNCCDLPGPGTRSIGLRAAAEPHSSQQAIFCISHWAISAGCVSARHTFSGG